MKKFFKVIAIILAIYLALSLAASAVIALTDNRAVESFIINNRYGLLLMECCLEDEVFVIWSPFNNACDVFLLVVDWEAPAELRVVSDGFYAFGLW